MAKSLAKNIMFYIAILTMFVGGILFVLMSDLTYCTEFKIDANPPVKNAPSIYLIGAVLLSFGSAILFFFSNNYAEKPWAMYLMKGLGVALGIGLIGYYHWFSGCNDYVNAMTRLENFGIAKESVYVASKACIIVSLALAYIGTAAEATSIALTAILKDDIDKGNKEDAMEAPAEEAPVSEDASQVSTDTAAQ